MPCRASNPHGIGGGEIRKKENNENNINSVT
jgi:hypothetical protein